MTFRALTVLASDFRHIKDALKPPGPQHGNPSSDGSTVRLYDAATGADRERVTRTAAELQKAGIRNHDIKISIVPAIARRVGEGRINDTQGFGGVTIGCARLQSIVRHLPGDPLQIHAANRQKPKRSLVVVPEGAQHTLGAVVLIELLRNAGAAAVLAIGVRDPSLSRLAPEQRFDAVMISASQGLCVRELRATSHSCKARRISVQSKHWRRDSRNKVRSCGCDRNSLRVKRHCGNTRFLRAGLLSGLRHDLMARVVQAIPYLSEGL